MSEQDIKIHKLEEVATKFNFLIALSIGGGALSAFAIIRDLIT